ncbi:Replication factor C subunit 1 [Galdieria sulphuraria]|nr:Replication factor C subunit 1 [Galdieria sulphuraria]
MAKIASLKIQVIDEDGLFDLIRARSTANIWKGQVETKTKLEETKQKKPTIDNNIAQSATCSELWTYKYAPCDLSELCANPGAIKSLKEWLVNWKAASLSQEGSKNKGKSSPKAVLLSGPPGIGKTTAALLVSKELGYFPMEFNASDTRNRAIVSSTVGSVINNQTLNQFGKDKTTSSVIIMDEVDGMSAGDRGGIQELIQLIKKTSVPIVCICNDDSSVKVRSLANYCLKLKWRRPLASQLRSRLLEICKKEGFENVDTQTLEKIVESCHGDMRQILNLLQSWRSHSRNLTYSDVLERMKQDGKTYEEMSIFELVKSLFSPGEWLSRRLDNYFMDPDLMPLMVAENYIISREASDLKKLVEASTSIAEGDIFNDLIRRQQAWNLMPVQALFSGIYPGQLLQGPFGDMIHFPSWLGKNSTRSKNKRLTMELQMRMSNNISGSFHAFLLEYLPCLRSILSAPLVNSKDGVSDVIERLDAYYLSKDDWDTLMSLSLEQKGHTELDKIPTATKTAFTREYNSRDHRVSTASAIRVHKVNESALVEEGESMQEETEVVKKEEDVQDMTLHDEEEIASKLVRSKGPSSSSKVSSKNSKTVEKDSIFSKFVISYSRLVIEQRHNSDSKSNGKSVEFINRIVFKQ